MVQVPPPSSETLVQKTMRKLERGVYTATNLRWGRALELNGDNRAVLMGQGLHGEKNQQVGASFKFPSRFSLGADRCLALTPGLQTQIAVHDCSGSSFPAVQVSPSTTSSPVRSLQPGT